MTRRIVLGAILVWATLVGCGASGGQTKDIDVSLDDVLSQRTIARDIALSVGDTLKLSLGANNSTPYRWTEEPKIGDPGVLKQTGHEYKQKGNMPGSPGIEVWRFKALQVGASTIIADYARIAGGDPAPTCIFTAHVTVQ